MLFMVGDTGRRIVEGVGGGWDVGGVEEEGGEGWYWGLWGTGGMGG